MEYILPDYIMLICGFSSLASILISIYAIYLQFINYRKPFEQRLIVRIQIMVPLYATTCYIALTSPNYSKFVDPIREIYEAFVIYTFFSLLTMMLGGERAIIFKTSGRMPVYHPKPLSYLLPAIDISDPLTFLTLKREILQYVWIKPFLCLIISISQMLGTYNVNDVGLFNVYIWTGIIYNMSATMSLYALAIFWKCLYNDLKPFNPWGKFLCVKFIIFVSYWQGVLLAMMNWLGLFDFEPEKGSLKNNENNAAIAIQNAMLCVELIGFALGHWYSFNYKEFDVKHLPNCSRLKFKNALKDCFGIGDLVYDFQVTFKGEGFTYRNFDSVEALIAHPLSQSRMARINQGMRYSEGGSKKYWLPSSSEAILIQQANANNNNSNYNSKTPLLAVMNKNGIGNRAPSIASSKASTRAIYEQSLLSLSYKTNISKFSNSDNKNNNNNNNITNEGIDGATIKDQQEEEEDEVEDYEQDHFFELSEQEMKKDDKLYEYCKRHLPFGDKHYPVEIEIDSYMYSKRFQKMKKDALERQIIDAENIIQNGNGSKNYDRNGFGSYGSIEV
ncbi:hypothetical protein PACTADRAFT_71020 [Pachysolen tannophilus NRRL Y-2460]|uniref:DUF300-domain-containing protein n=1 Tax=Pachysolen tannophilus NRRL Y-2460 TaxID=669874 RepID=A0A1E4TRK3_PACTA|nr:hypothetical protein PACTADRAFT_71020 [Pachysolen tannophilus NRRL Y-2460]